jgi:hypothetical protein
VDAVDNMIEVLPHSPNDDRSRAAFTPVSIGIPHCRNIRLIGVGREAAHLWRVLRAGSRMAFPLVITPST